MRIICGKCQSAFNLNLDGIHLQRFQFKCPSCAGLVLVDRAEAPAPIKVAGAPAVLVPIGSQAAPASKPAATPPPASEPQAIITPPPPRRAETPLTPPPASSPAAASVASPADDELPNAKFREAPTDRVGAVTPPKAVESPSVPAGPVRGAVAATAAAAPAALALPPIPPSAAASVAAKLPPREPRPVVAAKVEPASASATAAKAVSPAKPADPSPARAADKPDKVEPARPAGAEGIEAARAEILAQHAELMKKNWFELLGVKQDAPLDEIKSAYFKLAKQYHPDRFVATMSESELAKVRELSSRVNQAFQDLRSDASRQEYIKKLIDPEREKKRLEASAIIEAMIDHEKGRAALKQSNFEQALQHFQRAAALHPGEAEYHFMIAQSLQRARGVENSSNRAAIESELRKAVDLQPNNAGYRIGIGHYWKARGEPEKALGHYKEALKLDPKNHEAIREIRLFESRKEKAREERKRAAPPGGRSGLGVRFGLR